MGAVSVRTRWVWLVGLAAVACASPPATTEQECVPGRSAPCACVGGASGTRACGPAGTYGACECAGADAGADVAGDQGAVDTGTADTSPPGDAMDAAGCDEDRDGVQSEACGGTDCDDRDAERYPGARERCDGTLPSGRSASNHDEDCNPCTVTGAAPDGDADRDGYPAAACANPWTSVSRPVGCMETLVRVDERAMTVAGADCNDSPDAVARDGGVGDAAADGSTDGGARVTTGREIRPNQTEVCDGLDNNCNGMTDEGDPGGGGTCGSGLPGVCAPGVLHCSMGTLTCAPNVRPDERAETCNGIDDDCDGTPDDGDPGAGATCSTALSGVCAPGVLHCNSTRGAMECRQNVTPSAEVCDNQDNNCNGLVDDGAVASCPPTANAVATCVGGRCGFECSPGFGDCDGNAANGCEVNLTSTPTHCGACRRACSAGATCAGGGCTCAGGGSVCDGACRSLLTDANHCGRCGNACGAGTLCVSGACACTGGQTSCGGTCVNTQTDSANCGTCGTRCPTGRTCVSGVCACTGGQTDCGGTCRSLLTDGANCGACGRACAGGMSCISGACACTGGQANCSGTCRTLSSDPLNCGACGRFCLAPTGGTPTCVSGVCSALCPSGRVSCGGACQDLSFLGPMPGVRRYTNDPSITHLCGRVDSTGSQGWYFPGGTGSSCVGIELFIFPFSLWRGRYRFWVDAGWNATAGSAFQLRAVRTDGHVYNSQTHVLGTDTASSYRTTSVEFNIPDDCASMRLQLLVLVSSPGGFFTAETGLDRIP